jgi:hypothetical protein
MKYLKPYKIFESNQSDVDTYLSKIGATRKDITDVFNGIIDLGYEPNFKLIYVDKEGNSKKEKSTAQETPIVLINFKSDKSGYVGGSIRFNNLDYIENLYHSLATLMSMYGDECKIEYDLDNLVELELRLQFETEYDESKVSLSKDEIYDALKSCLSVIPEGYTSNVVDDRRLVLEAEPDNTIGQKLLDELIASKTAKVVSNYDEVEKIGLDVNKELAKLLSERFKKDIRYVRGISYYTGTGLFLFNDDKQEQMIAKVITTIGYTKTYSADIKRGFLKTDKCEIELETLEIEIKL